MLANGTGTTVTEEGGKNWYIVYPDYAFGQDMQEVVHRPRSRPAAASSADRPDAVPERQLLHVPAQGADAEPEAGRARHHAGRRRPGQPGQAVQRVQAEGQGHRPRGRADVPHRHPLARRRTRSPAPRSPTPGTGTSTTENRAWADKFQAKTGTRPTFAHAGNYSAAMQYLEAVQRGRHRQRRRGRQEARGQQVRRLLRAQRRDPRRGPPRGARRLPGPGEAKREVRGAGTTRRSSRPSRRRRRSRRVDGACTMLLTRWVPSSRQAQRPGSGSASTRCSPSAWRSSSACSAWSTSPTARSTCSARSARTCCSTSSASGSGGRCWSSRSCCSPSGCSGAALVRPARRRSTRSTTSCSPSASR